MTSAATGTDPTVWLARLRAIYPTWGFVHDPPLYGIRTDLRGKREVVGHPRCSSSTPNSRRADRAPSSRRGFLHSGCGELGDPRHHEIFAWINALDDKSKAQVVDAIDRLTEGGPGLGRPLAGPVGRLRGPQPEEPYAEYVKERKNQEGQR